MKKLLLLVLLIGSASLMAQSIRISGAGTAHVNGIYCVQGTYNGANYYTKDNIYVYRNQSGSHWRIGTILGSGLGNSMYYTTYDESSNNPSVPWSKTYYTLGGGLGSAPSPSIESSETGDFVYLTFNTQQQIDDFGANYPCASVVNSLFIGVSSGSSNIHDLSPLENITEVTGNVSILNTSLTHVDGLSGLETTGGYIFLRYNHSLENLDGFSNLETINGYIEVRQNNVIEDISGLQNIDPATITNDYGIQIVSNPNLSVCNLGNFCEYLSDSSHPREIYGNQNQCVNNDAVLTACANSCSVGDYTFSSQQQIDEFALTFIHCENIIFNNLTIEGNDITNLAGLNKTTQIEGYLTIRNNPLLQSIQPFNQIENTGGDLVIQNNASLSDLEGLNNLSSINGNLIISDNAALIDIAPLINLNPESITGTEGLMIENNELLAVCNLPNLCTYLSNPENPRSIQGNAENCLDEEALELVCGHCEVPFNLSADNIVENMADLFWDGEGEVFDIQYGPAGFVPGGGTIIESIETNTYQLTGLNANTSYDFYVRQDCSGFNLTEWVGPFNFTTRAVCPAYIITQTQQMVDDFGVTYGHCTHVETLYLYGTATHLDGLSNLTSIGSILAPGTHYINNYEGLNNLTTVTGVIQINYSSGLETLSGFESLTSVGNRIDIVSNPHLKTITAFSNLTELNAYIRLQNNLQLTDISGFENIQPESMTNLIIYNNPMLSACNLPNFCDYLSFPAGSYPRTISYNGTHCTSPAAVVAVCSPIIWTLNNEWSNTSGPTTIHYTEILGNLSVGSDTPDFESKTLTINPDASLTIESGHSVSVQKDMINLAGADAVVVENNANLIQTSAVSENQGDITVHRNSEPMLRLDYTLWSSPVVDQNLFGFSPETINGVTNYPGSTGRIYVYDGDNAYVNPQPFDESHEMEQGLGYLFRSPNNYSSTVPEIYQGVFIGTPFSGDLSVPTAAGSFTSIGNPYPSNIMLNDLFMANPGINAVYFWNNNHSAGNNYATCTNGMGCVAASGGGNTPNGILTTGQGFIVHTDDTSVVFNNTMRVNDSGIFFKVDELESHRFRLNLDGQDESYNQILMGYVSEATNQMDAKIDGKMFDYEGSALYNLIDEEPFVIQGRALPFESSDVVQLGFRAAQSGKFKISLADFDGIFAEGNLTIYLKDNELGITHNLMGSEYEFESTQGEFKERFEVIYETEETMGTGDYDSNLVQIYQNENQIIVESKTEKILSVELFDMNGRNLHRNAKVNANHYEMNSKTFGTQVLVVKVQTRSGEVATKKLINK